MEELSLLAKLNIIQTELEATKGRYNKFGNYKYRSAEDILNALKPHFKEHGLVLTFKDSVEYIEGWFYIKAEAILTDLEDKYVVTTYGWARESETKKGMDSAQVTGSTSSYARKYALTAMFAIDDTHDSDTTNHGEETPEGSKAMKAKASPKDQQDEKHKEDIRNLMMYAVKLFGKDDGAEKYKTMLNRLGVKQSSDIKPAQINEAEHILNVLQAEAWEAKKEELKKEEAKKETTHQEEFFEL